jgi:FKBP-type peptidyl-prolyl cis-trans isomerase FklB
VKTLPSGLQYKVLKEGTGAIPTDTSLVKVHYEGRLVNDTIFDSSYKRGEPTTFRCNQVIKGWTEALCHMPAGSVWEVYIPQELAYGERQQSKIDPFSALIFKIELLEVNPKKN